MTDTEGKYVTVALPAILFGGDAKGLIEWMALRGVPMVDQPGRWRICTDERYFGRARPGLLTYRELAGPGQVDRIRQILSRQKKGPSVEAGDEAIARVNQIGDRLGSSSEIVDMFSHLRLATIVVPDHQLAEVLGTGYEALLNAPLSDDPQGRPFAHAAVHLVDRDPALTHRLKFPSVWLRFDYDSRLASGEAPVLGTGEGGDVGFASAFDLHSGMLMFDLYFSPLAGCLSPYIWCLIMPRTQGIIIVDLGTTLNGIRSESAELLDTLPIYGSDRVGSRPQLAPSAFGASLAWWTEQLDTLFGILSDPSVFADADGNYQAAAHMHALLTVEQLFRRVVSIQGAARDTHAARVLLFSVLDTLQRLTSRPIETHCSADFARRTLDRVRLRIPTPAQDLLLWGPERAVRALADVQDGFFLRSITGDQVVLRAEGQADKVMPLDQAAAHYLKVIRDATHGHGSNKDNAKGKTNALLAQHDGRIPHDVAGLGFLYMLDVLTRPDDLRKLLASQSRRA